MKVAKILGSGIGTYRLVLGLRVGSTIGISQNVS